MAGNLSEKREDELKLLWKTKLLELSAGFLGYVVFSTPLDKSRELKLIQHIGMSSRRLP